MTTKTNAPTVRENDGGANNERAAHGHDSNSRASASNVSPVDTVLARLTGAKRHGDHYTARCPGPGHTNGDKHPSLSISKGCDGRALLKCHAGCSVESIVKAMGLTMADLMPPQEPETAAPPALTVERYAAAKRLPVPLLESARLKTVRYGGGTAVVMPYRNADGTEAAARFRLSMDGPERFRWKTGARPCLYGLDRLDAARAAGYVVIVEGESDCHTLWHHGIPAVGIPGASNWNEQRDAPPLSGIPAVYVVMEPDTGGEAVRRSLSTSSIRDRARLVDLNAATGYPDVSAVHMADPEAFAARWQTAVAAAVPFPEPEAVPGAEPPPPDADPPPPDADPSLWAAGIHASRMDLVQPERITWVWQDYIPAGAVTVMEGDGGRGKSLVTLDITARVTRGDAMPDGTPNGLDGPAAVILMGLEDGKSTTVRPRLDAAGADITRVYVYEGIRDAYGGARPASLAPEDLPRLESLITQTGAKMVIVDAFTAVLPGTVDSHKDQSIRAVLMPLKQMAERHGVAVVLIRHWSKGVAARASDRGIGSVGIGNTARSRLVVGDDPGAPGFRAIGQTKLNLVPDGLTPLQFRVVEAENGQPRIEWTGRAACSADDIVMRGDQDAETRTAKEEAEAFLWEHLADGPKPAREVEQAARVAGIERKPLRAAREAIERAATTDPEQPFKMSRREGFGPGSVVMWELPDATHRCPHTPIDAHSGNGHVCGSEGMYGEPPSSNGNTPTVREVI